MEKRITPTAHLVLSADAPREEWLAERRNGITATDLPAILGQNKYKTAIDVWMEKVAPGQDDFTPAIGEHEAALWGIVLEDTVARTWAEHAGLNIRRIGLISHEDQPWMRASLDRIVTGCQDGRCALEVKTRSGYVGDDWDKAVPADVQTQAKWQLLVSGLDHVHVIALIGGQRLVQHVVKLDQGDRERLTEHAKLVWDSVATGEAPKLPESLWTDDYLAQLHPTGEGDVEVDASTAQLVEEYATVSSMIRELEGEKAELKTQLAGAIGSAETASINGRVLYSYKASNTRRLDTKALAELYPDAAGDDRVYTVTTSRTLRLTTAKDSTQ